MALTRQIKGTVRGDYHVIVCVDADDPTLPQYHAVNDDPDVSLLAVTRPDGHARAINFGAMIAATIHTHIAKLDDDHWPITNGWDVALIDAAGPVGIAYGDDLLQGEYLPTAPVIASSIVEALGHMCPPVLRHMYVDNYWKALGEEAECLAYEPRVVVEHRHPMRGDRRWVWDKDYERAKSHNDHDRDAMALYMSEGRFTTDVEIVKQVMRERQWPAR